jgi:hypothetical protein
MLGKLLPELLEVMRVLKAALLSHPFPGLSIGLVVFQQILQAIESQHHISAFGGS